MTSGARARIGGAVLGVLGLAVTPWLLACGGAEEAPRPTASAASHDGSGTYWGGGGSPSAPPSIGGGRIAGLSGGGGGGGGSIGDALRRRRAARDRELRERLGPVRLTEDGTEAWPLYEGAVRRMEREVADEDDPCEQTMDAGEIFNEDVAGDHVRINPRVRGARCRAFDESMARCVDEEYVAAHAEECGPILRRAETFRRELRAEHPDADALEAAAAPERGRARRAGLVEGPEEGATDPSVLPEMDLPGAGNGR